MERAHAREMDGQQKEIYLENKDIVVERAHISGLERTKADYVVNDLKPLLQGKTFLQAYKLALECRDRLLSKGIFQSVDVYLDTTEAYEKKEDNGILILFRVKERSLLCGEARTEISNREKPRWLLKILSPNIFGRGEMLSTSFSHTFYNTSLSQAYQPTEFTTSFTKPFLDGTEAIMSLIKETQENPWSCCKEITRGMHFGYNFPLWGNKHSLEWLGHWRELSCLTGSEISIDIRRQLGHSLKSSLRHTVVIDRTDSPVLPKRGKFFKFSEELAGFGGDVKFIKETFESTYHSTFLDRITFGLGCQAGLMVPLNDDANKKFMVSDKFFIGGPLTLRGFESNRIGNGRIGSYLGSNCFWMLGGHIYTPLPFYWENFGQGAWLDNFRMHAFVNAGNAFDFDRSHTFANNINAVYNKTRLSYGFGIVYKLFDVARLEVNFCVPVRYQENDFTRRGLQFGIGISTV